MATYIDALGALALIVSIIPLLLRTKRLAFYALMVLDGVLWSAYSVAIASYPLLIYEVVKLVIVAARLGTRTG